MTLSSVMSPHTLRPASSIIERDGDWLWPNFSRDAGICLIEAGNQPGEN